MEAKTQIVHEFFSPQAKVFPFSFLYAGKPFAAQVQAWKAKQKTKKLDANRTQTTQTWTDPATGLLVRCEAIEYHDFPTVEWTVYFKNTGKADTPILEKVQALDLALDRGVQGEFLLHHAQGSLMNQMDYAPLESPLPAKATKRLAPEGGRGSNGVWPYFNLEWQGAGRIIAVGWPGQWAAEFTRDDKSGLHLTAGQELTHFKLLPGEEVRTPLIVIQSYAGGTWIQAQNVWRRWMMAHSMPRPGGKLPPPMLLAASSRAYMEMTKATEENQKMFIDRYLEEGLKLDYWWMDAGWYVIPRGIWTDVGTWEVDRKRFPKGLRAVADHAHQRGMKTVVWFEPERVEPNSWLTQNHPEWISNGAGGGLLNLGNPETAKWLTDHVDKLITSEGIDLYRQDFNMDPLAHWRKADAPDRQGIAENKHVMGYLAYWDELLRRHPGLLIDSCASGGRRNDLETMRRAVPLWRSDYAFEPIGEQCMTYGISLWLPFQGTGTVASTQAQYYGDGFSPVEPYAFWSNASPSISCGFDLRVKNLDYATLRKLFAQFRELSPNYYGDFYPLTPHTTEKSMWIAWQFDRPEAGQGMIQAFRRAESPFESARLTLHGLDPAAEYEIRDIDRGPLGKKSGKELVEKGLVVAIGEKPGLANLAYKKVK
jgi:alpha-galactosidase